MPTSARAACFSRFVRDSVLVVAAAIVALGCSRREGEGDEGASSIEDAGTAPPRVVPPVAHIADAAPPRDARAEDEEKLNLADAGRLCGDKGLSDCPLQLWMKNNATPTIRFGEPSAIADVFDRIASLAPRPLAPASNVYVNWVSIARDGADAARMGDLPAAKAACRGCHTQYRARYHADLRAMPLGSSPPVASAGSAPR